MDRYYRVLLVSASEGLNRALGEMLPLTGGAEVTHAGSVSAAKRLLLAQSYDWVIVNSPLPDDAGIRFASDASSGGAVALLLAGAETAEQIGERVTGQGVFVLRKPNTREALRTALVWLGAARERLRKNETKTLSLEEKMAEIRVVNRAKWLLIRHKGLDEPAAHRLIEKQAMDRCVNRRAVAEEIVAQYGE